MMHSIISKSHVLSVTSDSEAKFNDDDDEVSIIVLLILPQRRKFHPSTIVVFLMR